jgi:alpha-tubulin suppressor-like RCC1 family protein
MTSSNYQTNAVDLDSTYIVGNDPNYQGVQAAVTNRKTVIFGQQLLTQTYPIGNLNNAINYAQTLPGIQTDQDSVNITGVGPTAVFYKSRANSSQSSIRGNFNLLENTPQIPIWQTGNTLVIISSPLQVGSSSTWSQVATNEYATQISFALQNNGTVWGCGYGGRGALGNNSTSLFPPYFIQPTSPTNSWAQVASSLWTMAIQSNGTLWSWGYSLSGESGLNTTSNSSSPVQLGSALWSKIACAYFCSAAIQSNGTLWAWGSNRNGQIGNNSTQISPGFSSPIQIGSQSYWTSVFVGQQNNFAIQSNGTLWGWGASGFGRMGNNTSASFSSPVQVSTLSNWSQVACGYNHNQGILSDGTLWGWGANSFGQIGNNSMLFGVSSPAQIGSLSTWVQVACGYNFSMAIQSNGTLWAWGVNTLCQLGLYTTTPYSSPVQVGPYSNWSKVACAKNYTLAIQSNGTLWSWGNNSYNNGTFGQLGLQPTAISVTKVTYGL